MESSDTKETPVVATPAVAEIAPAAPAADQPADATVTATAAAPVEPEKPKPHPQAVQFIKISDDGENHHFVLDEALLLSVLEKIPADMKVSVVSVVGAFRTGKSFLLDIMLQYLRYSDAHPDTQAFNAANPGHAEWLHEQTRLAGVVDDEGFKWRHGSLRQTTGIWLWSEPFYRKLPNTNETVAVLLMDTQGMFDMKTSQQLTACIFGLSTLISSFQVYNLSVQIQEDNLQHLALFTEYGRLAVRSHQSSTTAGASLADADRESKMETFQPFQHLEFLVRDDAKIATKPLPIDERVTMMQKYLQDALSSQLHEDLRNIRTQISECFERVSCFMLPHPGYEVAEEETFDGSISAIRDKFLQLVEKFVDRVFNEFLVVKRIHGRDVSRRELFGYIQAYTALFQEDARFPKAETLFESTARVNNNNARTMAYAKFTSAMDVMFGPGKGYVHPNKATEHYESCRNACLAVFDSLATFGSEAAIAECRASLLEDMEMSWGRYKDSNANRNPLRHFELYIMPLTVAFIAYALRVIADFTCGPFSTICSNASSLLSYLYTVLFLFVLIAVGTAMRDSVGQIVHAAKAVGSVVSAAASAEMSKAKRE